MVNWKEKAKYDVSDLVEIVRLLRAPGGCPWDREQSHGSIRRNFLEEAYEVAEAIDEGNPEHLREELGDVLLQVVFHTAIEAEGGGFTLDDVADGVSRKLIFRHPHVFGTDSVSGSAEVLQNWEVLKRQEKRQETHTAALESVARSLPALWRAEKIQSKAEKAGLGRGEARGTPGRPQEEAAELRRAFFALDKRGKSDTIGKAETSSSPGGQAQTEAEAPLRGGEKEELGQLLFAAVNLARHWKIDPEDALHAACDAFTRRFAAVENASSAPLAPRPPAEGDRL